MGRGSGGGGRGGGGAGGGGASASPKQTAAANFWKEVKDKYGDSGRVQSTIDALEQGKLDWFRNASEIRVIAANQARFGRIGFNQDKYEAIIKDIMRIGTKYGIDVGSMQN